MICYAINDRSVEFWLEHQILYLSLLPTFTNEIHIFSTTKLQLPSIILVGYSALSPWNRAQSEVGCQSVDHHYSNAAIAQLTTFLGADN